MSRVSAAPRKLSESATVKSSSLYLSQSRLYAAAKSKKLSPKLDELKKSFKQLFGRDTDEDWARPLSQAPTAPKIAWREVRHQQALRDDYHYITEMQTNKLAQKYVVDEDVYATNKLTTELGQYSRVFAREVLSQASMDLSPLPEALGDYYYYARSVKDKPMNVYCRRKGSDGPEEILLDGNEELKNHQQLTVGTIKVNGDQNMVMALLDVNGEENFQVVIRDLSAGGKTKPVEITGICNAEWAPDGKSFYYTEPDNKRRPHRVFHHVIGTSRSQDKLVHEEKDDQFFVDVARTKDRRYLTINSNSKRSSELRILDAQNPNKSPELVMARQADTEFYLDHVDDGFYIVTADGADSNYKIMHANDNELTDMTTWKEVVSASPKIKIDDVDVLNGYLAIYERHEGLPKVRIFNTKTKQSTYVPFPSEFGQVDPGANLDPNGKTLRLTFTNPLIPGVVYDYHLETGQLQELRTLVVPKAEGARKRFDPADYEIRRVFVESTGDAKVPMTLVHRKGMQPSNDNPTLLTAYGAYGHNLETVFEAANLPLLERGFVIAFAHIRGGGDLGLQWHRAGRLLNKRNSFDDLQNCVQWLFDQKITNGQWLVGRAASAGGLPFAVLANENPGMFKALVLRAPFLDVITTMCDDTLPLTVHEYDEWGNPHQKEAFENIFSYDPYYNLRSQEYPHMYIQSSAMDVRVPAWNHARYVAKLRSLKTDDKMLLLKLETRYGHFGDGSLEGSSQAAGDEISFIYSALNIVPDRI